MAHMPNIPARATNVRAGTLADLDRAMDIMTRAFHPGYGEGWTRSQCAGIMPLPGVTLTVAAMNGDIVGFALCRRILDEAELMLLAVDPDVQGEGIGTLLVEEFVASSRANGASKLHLEVRDGNPAVALYHRVGFVVSGHRPDYYRGQDGRRFDAQTMSLELCNSSTLTDN